jgi:hypothetical protein
VSHFFEASNSKDSRKKKKIWTASTHGAHSHPQSLFIILKTVSGIGILKSQHEWDREDRNNWGKTIKFAPISDVIVHLRR